MRHLATVRGIGDDGQEYTILQYQKIVPAGDYGDPHATLPGMKSYFTDAGDRVNRKSKGVYEIVQTGVIVRSNSPEAP